MADIIIQELISFPTTDEEALIFAKSLGYQERIMDSVFDPETGALISETEIDNPETKEDFIKSKAGELLLDWISTPGRQAIRQAKMAEMAVAEQAVVANNKAKLTIGGREHRKPKDKEVRLSR